MFRIVTDTSANLPTDYLHAEQITVIPYTFQSGKGEQSCMDLTTFDAKDFYAQMRSGVKVTTSQIPPQRYIDVLTPLLEAGEDVLFVSMSSGISGAYQSAVMAARVGLAAARGVPGQEAPSGRHLQRIAGRGPACHARGGLPPRRAEH